VATVLKRLVESLLVPPGVVVALLVFAVVGARHAPRRVRAPLWAALLILWAASIGPFQTLLSGPLERAYRPYPVAGAPAGGVPDAIVVLGSGVRGSAKEAVGGETLSPVSLARLVYAFELHERTGAPLVVSGGDPLRSQQRSEARHMADLLASFGVDRSDVFIEEGSEDTLGNANGVSKILVWEGFRRPALVTSAVHMPRAVRSFRSVGVTVVPAPTDYSGGGWTGIGSLLPSADRLRLTVAALHEWIGLAWYRVARGV